MKLLLFLIGRVYEKLIIQYYRVIVEISRLKIHCRMTSYCLFLG